ncbi:MAG TPA: histidinol-phosphate aminotransferase family protein [Chloroflexi bacterium]|nr:histidinol-phosphate aminotransferase family protein [Chloroflexota bacterium]
MDLEKFVSKSAKAGEIYNLNHFRTGWHRPVRRLMGNELVFPPSPKVIEAVKNIADKLNYYPEDALTDVELREKLAEYSGLPGRPDWITCGCGSSEIIDMLYETFLDEGDEIILSNPDYSPYARRTKLYGAVVVEVQPADEDFNYTLESFTGKITPKTKMIMLSRPNNPDGHQVPKSLVRGLLETGLIIVVDEAYVEFGEDSCEDMLDEYENLIISHTFSKAMGLAGIRLGWIVARPEIINYVNAIRTPLNVGLVTHVAAIAAIEDADYIRANAARIKADREYFFNEIKKIPGMRPIPSQANFVMVDCLESGLKASEITNHLLERGYLIRCFVNARGLPGDRYYRVTIGTHEDVVNVLNEIKAYAQAHAGVTA